MTEVARQPGLSEKGDGSGEPSGPVECLGMTFPNDEARREYFLERLKEKLADPEFRRIEGFPIARDEDILALSDPPYYTACPNPFIEDFVRLYGKPYDEEGDDYHREPFAADVSESKNGLIYNAHAYHTKVPHKAIMRYILHYTEPGDIVFDGFCGSGMTGVAAHMCASRSAVEELGYKVTEDGTVLDEEGRPFSKLGARRAILNDLSPAATFIAYNYNAPVDVDKFEREARRILDEVEAECGWMYETLHHPSPEALRKALSLLEAGERPDLASAGLPVGRINYTVWSDVFVCPNCLKEVIFQEAAVDKDTGKVRDKFPCPHCRVLLTKTKMERAWVTRYDEALGETIRQAKQVPVLINYSVGKFRYEKAPDAYDLALIKRIEESHIPYWYPTNRVPEGYNTEQPKLSHGITHVHHFYTKRNLIVLATFLNRAKRCPQALLLFNSQLVNISRMNRYRPGVTFPYNPLSGTLYIGSQISEANPFTAYSNKIIHLTGALGKSNYNVVVISCHSSSTIEISSSTVDYIFTDPPFGSNLMYSELNFLWESWLRVFTNNKEEAVINRVQRKGLAEYQEIMTRCFQEYYRVLKPGRWMTVEFHNSQDKVWHAIQEALQKAGFVVADVRTLDKQQGSFKQVTTHGAVKQDLIISAYKPRQSFVERFKLEAGTEQGAWDFVRQHLEHLPVFVTSKGKAQVILERQSYALYDRMVAYHVQHGVTVPLSAAEFYAGLKQRFPERDGMYFLPHQAAEYDRRRLEVEEMEQLPLIVTDEQSAIRWLRQELSQRPQTYSELQPKFLQELHKSRHERMPELAEILEQNFLQDERGRWYVPDPAKQTDLEKVREKALLREFEEYARGRGQLKEFRTEAVRAGFSAAWRQRDYKKIVQVAERLPNSVLQEEPELLMYYDNALDRV